MFVFFVLADEILFLFFVSFLFFSFRFFSEDALNVDLDGTMLNFELNSKYRG